MAKNVLIAILLILLGITSYLLFEKEDSILRLWAQKYSNYGSEDEVPVGVEKLGPKATPELNTDPSIGLTIENMKDGDPEADEPEIHLKYKLIRPSKFDLFDAEGNLVVVIDLKSGGAIFGSSYSPDEASIQFWKSIAEKYPEVCITNE